MRATIRSILFLGLIQFTPTIAQTTWRTDTLMASWPVQERIKAIRPTAGQGVVRAVDTRGMAAALQLAAPSIPTFVDSTVLFYANAYGEQLREPLQVMLGLGELYYPMIEQELTRNGLPTELKHLPMALSAMNTHAGSRSGCAGLWMLSYPIAVRYGLTVTATVDERHDPEKSTVVACRYLKDLLHRYEDPGVALLAFTCGPANVTRAQQRAGINSTLGQLYPHCTEEQRDILPLLMAFIHLSDRAAALGIQAFNMRTVASAESNTAARPMTWAALAKVMDYPEPQLRAMNPTLVGPYLPAGRAFVLPAGSGDRYLASADSIATLAAAPPTPVIAPEPVEASSTVRYKVRPGDTLGEIAERYHVSVKQLRSWNGLRSDRIAAGARLLIHQKSKSVTPVPEPEPEGPSNSTRSAVQENVASAPSKRTVSFATYTVQRGDSLYRIAERFPGVSAQNIMEVNGIDARITPGQQLRIPRP